MAWELDDITIAKTIDTLFGFPNRMVIDKSMLSNIAYSVYINEHSKIVYSVYEQNMKVY
jgi:hypothetical protein